MRQGMVTTRVKRTSDRRRHDGDGMIVTKLVSAIALAVLGSAVTAEAATQSATGYPNRPIRVIVPQSAGGSTDLAARIVLQRMSEDLGQTFVVDDRPGAGSLNGT